MLTLPSVRLRWRESVSLGRFQNCNQPRMNNFRRHGVEDEFECLLILENQRHREVDSTLPAYRRRARRKRTHRDEANLPQPAIEILADERVIGQFGIAGAHPIDLLQLSGREVLRGVEAPAPREQARSEEHTSELQSLRHLVCRLLL